MKRETFLLAIIVVTGCRKPYLPPAVKNTASYLVVEGLINTGNDSTIFKLSRTVNVSAKKTASPELGATLSIESADNNSYPLTEYGNGKYAAPSFNLDNTHKYRLRIVTAAGTTYLSDFVTPVITPPINSVGYATQSNGMQLYVSTHDPVNNTHYYHWTYTETWIFTSYFASYYKVINGQVLPRILPGEQIYQCWGADTSSSLLLQSTSGLSKDIVFQYPILFVPSTSEKLAKRYSFLVQQVALSSQQYNYYLNVKKNTEQLGTLFDALPADIPGNVHDISNPAQPAIGYVGAGTTQQQRIFIDNRDLPAWLPVTFYETYGCASDTATVSTPDAIITYYGDGGYTPTISPTFAAATKCVDCTLRGTKIKPDFWK